MYAYCTWDPYAWWHSSYSQTWILLAGITQVFQILLFFETMQPFCQVLRVSHNKTRLLYLCIHFPNLFFLSYIIIIWKLWCWLQLDYFHAAQTTVAYCVIISELVYIRASTKCSDCEGTVHCSHATLRNTQQGNSTCAEWKPDGLWQLILLPPSVCSLCSAATANLSWRVKNTVTVC